MQFKTPYAEVFALHTSRQQALIRHGTACVLYSVCILSSFGTIFNSRGPFFSVTASFKQEMCQKIQRNGSDMPVVLKKRPGGRRRCDEDAPGCDRAKETENMPRAEDGTFFNRGGLTSFQQIPQLVDFRPYYTQLLLQLTPFVFCNEKLSANGERELINRKFITFL